ncbi:MAG: hypothetical protein JJ975_14570 [Bacteroidia bacterium]|nr:hypothetical protein [Bacteroidia bacterium]
MSNEVTKLGKILIAWLTILILSGTSSSSAQTLEWSNPRKLKGSAVFTSVIGENETGLYMLRFRNKFLTRNIIIERYRNHLGFALSKNITLKRSRLLYAELQEKGLLLLTAHYSRKGLQNEVRCQWYDANINPIGKQRTIATSSLADYYDKGDFRVRFSNDRKTILISHTEKSDQGKRILCIDLFDSDLNPLRSHRYELDIRYPNFYLPNIMVDNSGNSFFLISQRRVEHRREEISPAKMSVYWFDYKRDKLADYDILDSGIQLKKSMFSWDRTTNKVNLTALYTDKEIGKTKGLFNFQLWLDSSLKPKTTYRPFNDEFKQQLFGAGEGFRFDDVEDFELKRAIPNTDGGLTLIAERSSISNETDVTYINGMPTTLARNIYNFDDVLILAVNPDLKIRWKHLIHKSQSSLNDNGYYSSIVVAHTRSHIYLLYNDRLRTNGDVMQYMFDVNGQMTYKILVRSDNHFVSIIPSEAKQIGYNRVILPVTKDRKFSILKLDYPN